MNKEELLAEARKVGWALTLAGQNGDIDHTLAKDVRYLIECINKLDEPEVEENFYTFDNAKKWLQENGFVVFEKDKLDEEVQRMVDETYKEMNEKPVIPQFVADYIEKRKYEGLTIHEWFAFGNNDVDDDVNKWLYNNLNEKNRRREYLLIDAIRYDYEVEKEKKYRVVFNSQTDDLILFQTGVHIFIGAESANDGYWKQHFTEVEIKAIDKRYWAFAEEVM